jgi:PAS domain S-box-containing protein
MSADEGWAGLFAAAFKRSRNAMLLSDDRRVIIDVNPALLGLLGRERDDVTGRPVWRFVADGPLMSHEEWESAIRAGRFTGEAELVAAGGSRVGVQWAASVETVTGRRLVLVVAMSTSRWGPRFRRRADDEAPASGGLTARQREIIHLVSLGASGPEIAEELHISHDTVRTHIRNASGKLGARSRAHLVAKALANGHVPV